MKPKMRRRRLQRRIKDYEMTISRPADNKVEARKKSGDFRCPGSYTR